MDNITAVFTQNIIPIIIVAAFGYALQRWLHLDKKGLSAVVFNLLSPCLVFASLVNSQLPGKELVNLALFALATVMAMGGIGLFTAWILRLPRTAGVALILVVMFGNTGNYGLTLNQLRYGEAGLSRAVVFYTVTTIVIYTVGMFIATMGELNWRESLARLLRLPPLYAAVLAVLVYSLGIIIPAPILRGVEIAGSGAIPLMLLVLGMQIAETKEIVDWRLTLPAVSLRLLVAPLVAVVMAGLVGLQGLDRSTSIIEASMPTAVITIIIATEFDLQPTAVTSIVVLSTLISPLTVAATITLLGL